MQVNISVVLAPATYPAGTKLGQYRVRLSVGTVAAYTMYADAPLPPVVTFPNVAPGTYTLSIVRLNTGSQVIGAAYTDTVVVDEPPPVVGDSVVGATITIG